MYVCVEIITYHYEHIVCCVVHITNLRRFTYRYVLNKYVQRVMEKGKKTWLIIMSFPMVVQEAVWTQYFLENASQRTRKQIIWTTQSVIDIACNFFVFLFFCCTSLECLGQLFKKPFDSSHIFEWHFKRPSNTSLSLLLALRDANDVFSLVFFSKKVCCYLS